MGRKATGSKSEYKMEKVPMTKAGHAAVENELKQLNSHRKVTLVREFSPPPICLVPGCKHQKRWFRLEQ